MLTFGGFVKDLRIKKTLTLREFCRILHLDPSNWSKIERGLFPPPKSKKVLNELAKVLNLDEGSEDYATLIDLAAIAFIPTELLSDQQVIEKLPIFFRTVRGEKPNREELEELIDLLKNE